VLQDLLTYSLEGLHELWNEVQGHSEVRQEWITALDESLKKLEGDRMEMVRVVAEFHLITGNCSAVKK